MAPAPENSETIRALFVEALELSSAERPAFLLKSCSDPVVRAEVQRLLSENAQTRSFLSTPNLGDPSKDTESHNRRFRTGEILAGRFKIIRFIAAGGMGEVYEAEDVELHEHVAVKTILPDFLRKTNAASRFKREIHLARKVTHPNVCRIFDLFRHAPSQGGEETLFVSMELLQGKTLAEQLEANGRITMQEALPLVTQMATALSAAHDVGIVHRDFKPGNVVLVPPKRKHESIRVVVTDFGLASRSLSSTADGSATTLTTMRDFSGTPAYMAPEQIEGHPATAASDIYALGLVIYEMVTGQRPFQADNPMSTALKRLLVAPTPPRTLAPELSPVWEEVILRCLEREPARRFTGAQDISAALIADEPREDSTTQPGDGPIAQSTTDVTRRNAPRLKPIPGFSSTQLVPPTPAMPLYTSRRTALLAASVLMLSVVAILAGVKYQRSRTHLADRISQAQAEQPGTTLSYYIIAQNYRDGRASGEPYRVSEHHVFEAISRIHLVFNSRQTGYLYILNEGPFSTEKQPALITLFPSPSTNAGSAQILLGQDLTIPEGGPLVFDNHRGTEKLWLVWSKESLTELEGLKRWANLKSHGRIEDVTEAHQIKSLLSRSTLFSIESSDDDKNRGTTLKGNGNILVHLIKLDHE